MKAVTLARNGLTMNRQIFAIAPALSNFAKNRLSSFKGC